MRYAAYGWIHISLNHAADVFVASVRAVCVCHTINIIMIH